MGVKHFIEMKNGEEVSAIHHEAESDKWVFFCHGFADTKERSINGLAERVSEESGFNTVVFDFRGNGESSREFAEATLTTRIEDLNAVIDYFEPERCFVYGTSFGAKVAFHTAANNSEVEALVTKAPVTYNEIMDKFRDAIEENGEVEFYGKTFDNRFFDNFDQYSFNEVVEKLDVLVLIFHGAADTTVHDKYSFRAAQKLDTDVALHKLKDEKHSFSDEAKDRMITEMVEWLHNNRVE